MEVIYAFCVHCDMEWIGKVFLELVSVSKYANRHFLRCPECGGTILPNDYEIEEEEKDEE